METSQVSLASSAPSLRSIDNCSIYSDGTDGSGSSSSDTNRGWSDGGGDGGRSSDPSDGMMSSAFSRTLSGSEGMMSSAFSRTLDGVHAHGGGGVPDGHGMSSHLDGFDGGDWDGRDGAGPGDARTGPLHRRTGGRDDPPRRQRRRERRERGGGQRRAGRRTDDPDVRGRTSPGGERGGLVRSILRPPPRRRSSDGCGTDAGRAGHRVAWDLDRGAGSGGERPGRPERAPGKPGNGVDWEMDASGGGGTMDELVSHLLRKNYGSSSALLSDSVLDGYLEEFSTTSSGSSSRRDDWRHSSALSPRNERGGRSSSMSDLFGSRTDAHNRSGWSAGATGRSECAFGEEADGSLASSRGGASSCPGMTAGSSALTMEPSAAGSDGGEETLPPFSYRLGYRPLDPRHVSSPSDPLSDTVAANTLRPLDFAWILRSDGEWRYAIVADRPANWRGEGPGIRFVVDTAGNTKTYRLKNWGGAVRLPAGAGGDGEEEGSGCDETAETEPPDGGAGPRPDRYAAGDGPRRTVNFYGRKGSAGSGHDDSFADLLEDDGAAARAASTLGHRPRRKGPGEASAAGHPAPSRSFVDGATIASAVASITDDFCGGDGDDTDRDSGPGTESDDDGGGTATRRVPRAGVVSPRQGAPTSSLPFPHPLGAPPPSSLPFVGSSAMWGGPSRSDADESEASRSCTFEQLAVRAAREAALRDAGGAGGMSASTDGGGRTPEFVDGTAVPPGGNRRGSDSGETADSAGSDGGGRGYSTSYSSETIHAIKALMRGLCEE